MAAKDHMSTPAEAEEMQRLGEVFECLGYELAARNKLIGRILDDGIYKCKPGKTTPKPPDIEPSLIDISEKFTVAVSFTQSIRQCPPSSAQR